MQQTVKINRQSKERVCVFIDGTWNVEDNNTNVWRTYSLTLKVGSDGLEQTYFYTKGIGAAYGEVVRGGWFGYGLDEIVSRPTSGSSDAITTPRAPTPKTRSSSSASAAAPMPHAPLRGSSPTAVSSVLASPIGVGELFARAQTGSARTLRDLIDRKTSRQLNGASLIERWMLESAMPATIQTGPSGGRGDPPDDSRIIKKR